MPDVMLELDVLGWREVPRDSSQLGESVKPAEPVIRQVFVGRGADHSDVDGFERKPFPKTDYVCFTEYDESYDLPVVFPSVRMQNTLARLPPIEVLPMGPNRWGKMISMPASTRRSARRRVSSPMPGSSCIRITGAPDPRL